MIKGGNWFVVGKVLRGWWRSIGARGVCARDSVPSRVRHRLLRLACSRLQCRTIERRSSSRVEW